MGQSYLTMSWRMKHAFNDWEVKPVCSWTTQFYHPLWKTTVHYLYWQEMFVGNWKRHKIYSFWNNLALCALINCLLGTNCKTTMPSTDYQSVLDFLTNAVFVAKIFISSHYIVRECPLYRNNLFIHALSCRWQACHADVGCPPPTHRHLQKVTFAHSP